MIKKEKEILRTEKNKKELERLKKQRDNDIKSSNAVYEARKSTLKKNKRYHWPLFFGLKAQRILSGYKIHVLNELPKTYTNAQNEELNTFDRPIIFAPNHVRKKDIETLLEVFKKHVILLSGDFENLHDTFSGSLLEKNGIIYFDMDDPYNNVDLKRDRKYLEELEEYIKIKNDPILIEEYENELKKYNKKIENIINDRKNVKEVERQVLNTGNDIMKFFEASWDLFPNLLVCNGYYSLVQTAVDTNALVIPVIYEQPVDFDMNDKNIYIKFGKPIDYLEKYGIDDNVKTKIKLTHEEKKEGIQELRDQLATLLYEILEEHCAVRRKDIPKDYWEKYKKHVLSEWYFNEDDINKKHFVDKTITEQKDAFEHLNHLQLNKNNAFLLNKRNHQ